MMLCLGNYLFLAILFLCLKGVTAALSCWRNSPCTGPANASFPGTWESNIYSPSSRTVSPISILSLPQGNKITAFPASAAINLQSNQTGLVFDFGKEVGGIVTVNYDLARTPSAGEVVRLGLAFSEGKQWIGTSSDNSNGGFVGPDGALFYTITISGPGIYTMPNAKLRGGFRYLTLFLLQSATTTVAQLDIKNISLEIGFQPTWPNLRAYQGYFQSSDSLLNQIWYAGAYTLQTNAAPPATGRRATDLVKSSWFNDASAGPGNSIMLDGAKRDRWVWPGDMGVAVPSSFVSTGDMESVRNALQVMFDNQLANGELPKAGPPYLGRGSDTYHMWSMIGTYNYYLYTGDLAFVTQIWSKYLLAMDFVYNKVGTNGLLNATGSGDWGRWVYATDGSEPNMILYRTLITGATLLEVLPELSPTATLASEYRSKAQALRASILKYLWDDNIGAFRDSPNATTLYPQDANAMALAFSLIAPGDSRALRISTYLTTLWTPIGPSSPELPGNISPFISSIELEGHFRAGRADRALELIRTCWGWYHKHPNGTESTVIEGYLTDGTFGYRKDRGYKNDPSYTSHAHGWSSGPTSTLTEYFVGLQVTKTAGEIWSFSPANGSFELLTSAEAGFTTKLGKFSAKWNVNSQNVSVEWDTPVGTKGWIEFPCYKGVLRAGGHGQLTVPRFC